MENIKEQIKTQILKLKKGQIFRFGDIFEKNGISDSKTKLDLTLTLAQDLKNEIEICEEDRNSIIGLPFNIRYIRK